MAAGASFALALLHLTLPALAPGGYVFLGAGTGMVDMARAGSPFPAMLTTGIGVLLTLFGLYALAGAGLIQLPLTRVLTVAFGCAYLLRGTLLVPETLLVVYAGRAPQSLLIGAVSVVVGIVYVLGVARRWALMPESRL